MEQLPFQGNDGVNAGGTAIAEVSASAALRDGATPGGRREQSQSRRESFVGSAFSNVVEGGGGRGCQSLRPAGQPRSGLSGRFGRGDQPSAAAASAATATATATGPFMVGLVARIDYLCSGASPTAAGRVQLPAKPDGSCGPPAALPVAPCPGSPSILALSYGDRPQVLDAGCAVTVAVQKGHAVAHG